MYAAAFNGHQDVVELLADKGAKLDVKDKVRPGGWLSGYIYLLGHVA